MPIIAKVITLRKGKSKLLPYERKCALCGLFGAHAHGHYLRYPPGGTCVGSSGMILVPRFICLHCIKTFSLLPIYLVRRIGLPLPMLLFIARTRKTWDFLLELFEISRNTLAAWKRLGRALLKRIPELLEIPGVAWKTLSLHISRWQYPNNLRKPIPTLP